MSSWPPVPVPSLSEYEDEADEAIEALRALGLGDEEIEAQRPLEDRVFDAWVELWKKERAQPMVKTVAKKLGVSGVSVTRASTVLFEQGRMLHPDKGKWIPVL